MKRGGFVHWFTGSNNLFVKAPRRHILDELGILGVFLLGIDAENGYSQGSQSTVLHCL